LKKFQKQVQSVSCFLCQEMLLHVGFVPPIIAFSDLLKKGFFCAHGICFSKLLAVLGFLLLSTGFPEHNFLTSVLTCLDVAET